MTDKFVFTPIQIFQDERLSKIQIRVLLCLYSFRDAKTTNLIYPKRATIAKRIGGYSEEVISRTTSQLVKLGWISKVGNGGFSKSTTYQIHVPDCLIDEATTVTESGMVDTATTVTESVTVTESETVTESVPTTVTESVTTTVTESVTGNNLTIRTNHKNLLVGDKPPPNLNMAAWQVWITYRKSRGLAKYKTDGMAIKLAKLPHKQQMACVQSSIDQNYQGLFPEKFENESSKKVYQTRQEIYWGEISGGLEQPTA